MSRLFRLPTLVMVLAISLVFVPGTARSAPIKSFSEDKKMSPGYVFDDFRKITIKQPGDEDNNPYWWIINNGDGMQFYADCGDASCVEAFKHGQDDFARLQLFHDETPPIWQDQEYNGAEISEYRSGYSSSEPGRWLPVPGRPVTLSARVRFSANYGQDGHGGAVGTAGIWLWNSYPDFQDTNPVDAFGFNWVEAGSAGGLEGLQISAIQGTFPVYIDTVNLPIDMTAWHVWSTEWSVDSNGVQMIRWPPAIIGIADEIVILTKGIAQPAVIVGEPVFTGGMVDEN